MLPWVHLSFTSWENKCYLKSNNNESSLQHTIACRVVTRELGKVDLFKPLVVAIDCSGHSWPGLFHHLKYKREPNHYWNIKSVCCTGTGRLRGSFRNKRGYCVGREGKYKNLESNKLNGSNFHRTIVKLTFRALALRQSEWRRTIARNVSQLSYLTEVISSLTLRSIKNVPQLQENISRRLTLLSFLKWNYPHLLWRLS